MTTFKQAVKYVQCFASHSCLFETTNDDKILVIGGIWHLDALKAAKRKGIKPRRIYAVDGTMVNRLGADWVDWVNAG